jgi:hypothetical protein
LQVSDLQHLNGSIKTRMKQSVITKFYKMKVNRGSQNIEIIDFILLMAHAFTKIIGMVEITEN